MTALNSNIAACRIIASRREKQLIVNAARAAGHRAADLLLRAITESPAPRS